MARREQAVHDQAAGLLDDHRQVAGLAVAAQTGKGHYPSGLCMRERPAVYHPAGVVKHGDVMSLTGPVPADNTHTWPPAPSGGRLHGVEALSRFLIARPSVGHVPKRRSRGPRRAEGGSTKAGRHSGTATWPSPGATGEPRPGRAARPIVLQ